MEPMLFLTDIVLHIVNFFVLFVIIKPFFVYTSIDYLSAEVQITTMKYKCDLKKICTWSSGDKSAKNCT